MLSSVCSSELRFDKGGKPSSKCANKFTHCRHYFARLVPGIRAFSNKQFEATPIAACEFTEWNCGRRGLFCPVIMAMTEERVTRGTTLHRFRGELAAEPPLPAEAPLAAEQPLAAEALLFDADVPAADGPAAMDLA